MRSTKKSAAGYALHFALRLALAALIAVMAYYATEFWVLRSWSLLGAHVVEIVEIGSEVHREPDESIPFRIVDVELLVRVLTGEQSGRFFSIVATQAGDGGPRLRRGGYYTLISDTFEDGSVQYSISDIFRIPYVISVIVLACATLVAFAGRVGIMALLGLGLSIACLLWGFVPLAAQGVTPVPLAFVAVSFISLITIFCVVRRKQARGVALLGTMGGIGAACVIGYLVTGLWQLSGLAGNDAALLATTVVGIDMRGILLASVIIGAIGAVLDVSISITAAMSELVEYDAAIKLSRLWNAGLRVGSEVLGSMINTLVLAYLGASMPMALLISNAGADFIGLMNDQYISQEIVQSLAGTAGLILTIPMTAAFFVLRENFSRRKAHEAQRIRHNGKVQE